MPRKFKDGVAENTHALNVVEIPDDLMDSGDPSAEAVGRPPAPRP